MSGQTDQATQGRYLIRRIDIWDKEIVFRLNLKIKNDLLLLKKVYFLTHAVSPWWILWIGIGLTIFTFITQNPYPLVHFWGVLDLSFIIFLIIKYLIKRKRPYLQNEDISRGDRRVTKYGFPSGHTMFMMVAGVFSFVQLGFAFWILAVFVGATILTGLTRVYLGVHYPSDTIFGGVFGTLSAIFYYLYFSPLFLSLYRPDFWIF